MNRISRYILTHSTLGSISLRWKMPMIGIFIVVFLSILFYFLVLPHFEKAQYIEREGKLRAVVNSIVSLMDHYERSLRSEAFLKDSSLPGSLDKAKEKIINMLRVMRYDKNEFFFILDGNGNMIMHPLKPELEGQNMLHVKDPNGLSLFNDIVINSQRDGECVLRYIWQSKYSDVIFEPQTTYGKYYWPWDWVVCSGVYTQDIEDASKEIKLITLRYELLAAVFVTLLLLVFMYFNLSRPLLKLLVGIRKIKMGNLDYKIDIASDNEFGIISQQFNTMVQDLHQSRNKIIESQKKFKDLADLLPDIIYETDANFKITYLNKAGYSIFGYSEADLKSGLFVKNLIDKADSDRFKSLLRSIIHEKKTHFFNRHKIIQKDGQFIEGENHTLITYKEDQIEGLRGIVRDVTEKLKMEQNLIQSQKMETIGTLAGGIAHDFNNILTGFVGVLSLMKYKLDKSGSIEPDMLRENLKSLTMSADMATKMVGQILTISRKQKIKMETIDLFRTISNVRHICSSTFDKKIVLNFQLPENETAYIRGDKTQLEQVFLNLSINARDAMSNMLNSESDRNITLSVHIDRFSADSAFREKFPEASDDLYHRVTVRDTGKGMDEKILAKMFDPFFTTKEEGKGTGLGMAIAYNILKQHNSFIDVQSNVGVGTTVCVYIPAIISEEDSEIMTKEDEKEYRGDGTVLIIDDDPTIREIAGEILSMSGYKILTASDGEEGLELFTRHKDTIDVILLDLLMPKMSGKDVYVKLKMLDKNVKVVMASGYKNDSRIHESMEMGVNDFIQKPYNFQTLTQVIHDLIKIKQ